MLNFVKFIIKVIIKVAVGVMVGVMVNDFTKKYFVKPLQEFMDSLAEKGKS